MAPRYWLAVFTGTTWDEFVSAGAKETGFRKPREPAVRRMRQGDLLLCYVSRAARWMGVLQVVGEAFRSDEQIFRGELFPVRIPVTARTLLDRDHSLPVNETLQRFSWWDECHGNNWGPHFRNSAVELKRRDGEMVLEAIERAAAQPVAHPVDLKLWDTPPKPVSVARRYQRW